MTEEQKTKTASKTKTAENTTKKKAAPKAKNKKARRTLTQGAAHIQATYNNTIVTVTDLSGNSLGWASSGSAGFRGAKKATPYAAGQVVHQLMDRIESVGLRDIDVYVKGIGSGRDAAIRAFQARGVNVNLIKDVTPIPHNGVRPKKVRRV